MALYLKTASTIPFSSLPLSSLHPLPRLLSRFSRPYHTSTTRKPTTNLLSPRSSRLPYHSPHLRPSNSLQLSYHTCHATTTLLTKPATFPTTYQQRRGYIRATTPCLAGVHAFRLVHFVAPIAMKQLRAWIGTPSTNIYFYRRLLFALAILLGIPTAYIYTHLESTPYTDRVRFVALTSDDESKLGELVFSQLVEEHEVNFIPEHHRFVAHVTEVAQRIIEATNRSDITWEVRLIDSPVVNAFAIPGGKIFVFSGLLDVTQNDDGLAFILGHEVAHVLARHGAEQMAVGRVMLGVSVLLSALFGDNIGSFVLARVISLFTELRYSRNMEAEADYIGLLLMHSAKYDIDEAPKVWERMAKATGEGDHGEQSSSRFLSTHPSHHDRIINITSWVDDIKKGTHKAIAGKD